MDRKLLVVGDDGFFTVLNFDPGKKELDITVPFQAADNVSWVEPVSSQGGIHRLVGLSEGDDAGLLHSFEINLTQSNCRLTGQKSTLGAPVHLVTLRDQSALAVATYLGGSVALYPISITETDGLVFENSPQTEVFPQFPYQSVQHGPNEGRQRQCHVHQVIESAKGLLYAPDLGSDRVWIFRRVEMKLGLWGWLQCPPGTGPRHGVISPDQSIMYVIGELSHTVLAFDLSISPPVAIQPIDGFAPNVIPPNVHPDHQFMMDSGEICLHPSIPNVIYVSNRWERHISKRQPHLQNVPEDLPEGDAVAIILLSNNGRAVEDIKHVRTGLDVIRAMRLSDDGKYVAVAGQECDGLEIYEIGGKKGDEWILVASMRSELPKGLKHVIWL
ncbi:hypothetical protein M426DRAFT_262522 [Hypoxylon sp. CI-4A]|nr:hypothetical protein M426DRAFT_262522 [Hypoxylon sp. CI-4A]